MALYRERARFVAPKMLRVGEELFTADRFLNIDFLSFLRAAEPAIAQLMTIARRNPG